MTITIPLPYEKPPLSENQRLHWAKKASVVREVRNTARLLAVLHQVPRNCDHVTVSLHWAPARNGRRDAENPVPTLKALCDGICDAEVVGDDVPAQMTKLMPVIHPKSTTGKGQLWLEIEVTQ